MPYDPSIHHRRSIRLKGYDYSQAGMYFITITCQNRIFRFGKIRDGEMILNDFGEIAFDEWMKLPERYPNMLLDAFQVMPNHVHGIIVLVNAANGDDGGGGKNDTSVVATNTPTIGDIVGAYKSLVANKCLEIYKSRNEYMGKFWQRDYWDNIIRNETAYRYIDNYIVNNPVNWEKDRFFS